MRRTIVAALPDVVALVPASAASAGAMTYLSLGDSVAFGETDFTQNPSDGDRGFVRLRPVPRQAVRGQRPTSSTWRSTARPPPAS